MTPDDVAAIREDIYFGERLAEHALALCDALTAAWAERDNWVTQYRMRCRHLDDAEERAEQAEAGQWFDHATTWQQAYEGQRERAERAEQLANIWHAAIHPDTQPADKVRAEAALARVRELCDLAERYGDHLLPREVRAAIEGDNQ